jgi:DNA-binding response OmpR family regulator
VGVGSGDRPLVLVADDDQHILELVELALEDEGCAVLTATDGADAVRLAREHRPRLCVLDVMMPGMDGFEAARLLGDDERTARIPVLFLTAKERSTVTQAGFPTAAHHYLQKPFTPAALRARVIAVLSWGEVGGASG